MDAVDRLRAFAEWYWWTVALTGRHAMAKEGARAALGALGRGDDAEAVEMAVRRTINGSQEAPPAPDDEQSLTSYALVYANARQLLSRPFDQRTNGLGRWWRIRSLPGSPSEKAHAYAAEQAEQIVRRPRTCTLGHAFEGTRRSPCPTCGSPSIELVAAVRKEAVRTLAVAVVLAAGIPLLALLIGAVHPVGLPGLVLLVPAAMWVWGVANVIFQSFVVLRPAGTARRQLFKSAGTPKS